MSLLDEWCLFYCFFEMRGESLPHPHFCVKPHLQSGRGCAIIEPQGVKMTEHTSRTRKFEEHIPPETREHVRAAREEMRKSYESILPPGLKEHRHAARKEMLLAFRSLIDAAIEHTEEKARTA
jgi:hypothetical protein